MKIALAQINPVIADLEGNVARCLTAAQQAADQGADLVVFPAFAICGAYPRDILLDAGFVEAAQDAARDLAARAVALPPLIVGNIVPTEQQIRFQPNLQNAALWMQVGKIQAVGGQRLLRNDDLYFENRWFIPDETFQTVCFQGTELGILVGFDLYDWEKISALKKAGAEAFIHLAAFPFSGHADLHRRFDAARQVGLPIFSANLVGGNDEIIFDGHSFFQNADGKNCLVVEGFSEQVALPGLEENPADDLLKAEPVEELFDALCLGIRDFFQKNQIERAFLGLSGGIDSAVVAVLASRALGGKQITAVAMPSRYNNPLSTTSAEQLCRNLGINFEIHALDALHQAAERDLEGLLWGGTGAENIQARLRAVILMAYVNQYGGLLLNTSNKTEISLGYGTAYGDLTGTLSPIGDLTKPQVYALARWINRSAEIIPDFILNRPPSAELRPDQVDPYEYEIVSPQIEALVAANRSTPRMRAAESKRWQLGIVLKVSEKAFGSGRLIPVTRK